MAFGINNKAIVGLVCAFLLTLACSSNAWAYKSSTHVEKDDLRGGFYVDGNQIYERYDVYGRPNGYDTPDGPAYQNSDGSWDTPYGTFVPDDYGGYKHKDGYLEPDGEGGYYFHKY